MDIAALILATTSFGFSLYVFIDLMAQKKSTHQIQLIDPQDVYKPKGNKEAQPINDDFLDFDMPSALDIAEAKAKADLKRNIN